MNLDELLNLLSNDVAKGGIDANSPGEIVRSSLAGQMPFSMAGMRTPAAPMPTPGAPVAPVARAPLAPVSAAPSPMPKPAAPPAAAMPAAAPAATPNQPPLTSWLGNLASGVERGGGIITALSNVMDNPARERFALAEKARTEEKALAQQNMTVQAVMQKRPDLTPQQAMIVAQDKDLLRKVFTPEDPIKPEYKEIGGRLVKITPDGVSEVYTPPGGGERKLVPVGGRLMDLTDPANPMDVTPKERFEEKIAGEQAKIDLKTVDRYVKDAEDAESMLGDVAGLEAARAETTREGPTLGLIPKDYLPDLTPAAQRIASAAENVRLSFVQKTKGAVSDAEMKVFGMATPTMGMSDAAAKPIIEFMKLGAERVKERANFFDAWLRSKGTLDGAQSAWTKFTKEKPILLEGKDGSFTLSPENVGAWRDYFGPAGKVDATPSAPTATAPTKSAAEMSTEELRRMLRGGP